MSFSTAWRPLCRWMEIDGWYRSTLDRGCQQSVDRVSAECRQPIDRLAGYYRPTHESVGTRPTIARCWSSVDHVSVDTSTEWRPTYQSRVDHGSIEVSISSIDRHSIAGVISTHDPLQVLKSTYG